MAAWRALLRQLFAPARVAENTDGYGGLVMTEKGEAILFGRETVQVRPDPEPKKAEPRSRRTTRTEDGADGLNEADEALFQHLRGLRATIARAEGIAAFMVFPDRTLIEMARGKPVDLWALRSIHGVGERKREAYGERFTDAIREFLSDAAGRGARPAEVYPNKSPHPEVRSEAEPEGGFQKSRDPWSPPSRLLRSTSGRGGRVGRVRPSSTGLSTGNSDRLPQADALRPCTLIHI